MEVILSTCNKIEIPPKPKKKADNIIFKEIFFTCILDIKLIPFVISRMLVIIELQKLVGKLKKSKIGVNSIAIRFNILLEFRIDIITENKTTNPPIIITVEVEFVILFPKTSPILERVTVLL